MTRRYLYWVLAVFKAWVYPPSLKKLGCVVPKVDSNSRKKRSASDLASQRGAAIDGLYKRRAEDFLVLRRVDDDDDDNYMMLTHTLKHLPRYLPGQSKGPHE